MRIYISSYSSDCTYFKCQYDITLVIFFCGKNFYFAICLVGKMFALVNQLAADKSQGGHAVDFLPVKGVLTPLDK
jgi:hypothetical protein